MLQDVFIVTAAVGGTVMVCQFVLSLLGLGHHAGDVTDGDVADGGGSIEGGHGGDSGHHAGGNQHGSHNSSWLFGMLSFRTLSAALAFFGLAGYATLSAGQSAPAALVTAIAAGFAALYGVYSMMKVMYSLQSDGTLRMESCVGQRGAVYIPIPGAQQGNGKVQLKVQGRLIEVSAMTEHAERLPTGTLVEVTELISSQVVLVVPVVEAPAGPALTSRRATETETSAGTDVGD